ncbi:MAG TPA: TonB-dependent receptor [Allosphingosinicella sp.]|nr:TonB-dependent receptor [Allosphingosinicella sp.]
MRLKTLVLSTSSIAALAFAATPAAAQTAATEQPADTAEAQEAPQDSEAPVDPGAEGAEGEAIVVTGLRASLRSSQNIKRNSEQIVDSIVAEDIGKLPDLAVSETAARIPGVQVIRRGGEADTVLVRGLPDFATTYNGREIFTAETRVVALQDFPSANIAALEVFKTSTANLVEAGLAGLVNVRSRRPFDFRGLEVAGTVYALYTRQAGELTPNGNFLVSNRWDAGGGEIGALLNVSYTELQYLDSEPSNTDFIAGGPNGSRFPDIQRLFYRSGNRVRPSVNGAVQWRPSPGVEIYAEGLYQGFRNKVSDRLLSVPLWGGSQYTDLVFRNGTDLLQSGRVVDPFRPDGFQGGTFNKTDTYQIAVGGSWDSGPLRLSADVARTDSTFTGSTESVDFRFANRQTVIFNNGLPNGEGGGPEFSFENFDASNPANYLFQGFYEEAQEASGDDWQARLDAEYETGMTFLPKFEAGVRFSDRDAHREFGNRFAGFDNQAIPISSVPLDYQLFRSGFRGSNLQDGFRTFLSPTYSSIRENRGALRGFVNSLPPRDGRSFGVFDANAPAPDPLQTYDASERTLAGYAQVRFEFGETVDGVIGMRAVRTRTQLSGTSRVGQADPDGPQGPLPTPPSVLTPVSLSNSYTDWLPNASIRIRATPEVQVRFSASQTRTRPTFGQLNPSATLGSPPSNCPPSGNPFACAREGGGGNPFLRPFTSNNYDASVEYYFSRTGFASVALFHRDLNGFIQNQTIERIDPQLGPIRITGPVNTGRGRISGFEAQVSTFFDFLPGFLSGFGAQANVTHVDAKTGFPDGQGEFTLDRIFGVARWTYNLVGMYERGGLSVRMSYNQRGSALERRDVRGNPANPSDIYMETSHPAGRLDLSTNYRFNDNLTVFFDWTNILNDPFRQDLSSARDGAARAEYTRFFRIEETTYSLGLRFRL